MKRVVATGRTVEDAVTSALVRLGVTRSQATVRVVSEPVKGLFGFFGAKDAEVEVSVLLTTEETAKAFLSDLLTRMGLDAKVRVQPQPEADELHLDVVCDEESLAVVIGRHGSTLDALQYLVTIVANRDRDPYLKIYVDAGEYRKRRREGLSRMADRAAARAVRTRRPVALEAMPAADRKIIHTYLQERDDVTTTSEGVEPARKVIINPVVATSSSGDVRSHLRSIDPK